MSILNKRYRPVDASIITLAAGASQYIDLGVITRSGISVGLLCIGGEHTATWEFRYSKPNTSVGNDANTLVWSPNRAVFLTFDETTTVLNFASNNTILSLDINGDGTQKAWVKVTNTSNKNGTYFFSIATSHGFASL